MVPADESICPFSAADGVGGAPMNHRAGKRRQQIGAAAIVRDGKRATAP